MYRIEIHREAEMEIIEAAEYYHNKVENLGLEFLEEVEAGLSQVKKHPFAWSKYENEYRRYLIRRFPFGLICRIEGLNIFVLAAAHLHRKPGYWKDRK